MRTECRSLRPACRATPVHAGGFVFSTDGVRCSFLAIAGPRRDRSRQQTVTQKSTVTLPHNQILRNLGREIGSYAIFFGERYRASCEGYLFFRLFERVLCAVAIRHTVAGNGCLVVGIVTSHAVMRSGGSSRW